MAGGRDNLRRAYTPEEARVYGARGGKASAAARKRKKSIGECLEALAAKPVKDREAKRLMASMGIADSDMQYAMLVAVGLLRKAADGDGQAARLLMEAAGEAQASGSNVVVNIIDDLK